jgi:hypothetical protein
MRIEKLWKNLCQTVRTGARRLRTAVAVDVVLLLCLGAFTYREIYEAEAWYLEEAGSAAAAAAVGCIFAVSLHLFFERRGKEHRRVEAILTAAVCAAVFILVRGHSWTVPYILLQTLGAALSFAAFGLYCLEGEEEGRSAPLVIFSLCKAAVVGTLLTASLNICLMAFDSLIVSVPPNLLTLLYFLIAEVSYIFAGGQVALAGLPVYGQRAEMPALFRVLLARILWPACLILLVILYLYVAKIIFLWEIPVGMMNWFASLALLAFAVFFVCFAGDERHPFLKFFLHRGLPAFLPILAVQAVAVCQRIAPYGLTAPRYASILCTAFGIFLLICAFRRSSPRPAFLVLAVMIAVSALTPLSILDIPLRTQEARLWSVLEENDMIRDGTVVGNPALSLEAQEKLLSASEYLTERGQTAFLETPGMNDTLAELRRSYEGEDTVDWFLFTPPDPAFVPVAGWQEAYVFSDTPVRDGVLVVEKGAGAEEHCDVSAYVAEALAYAREHRAGNGVNRFTREMQIDLDDRSRLCLSELRIMARGAGEEGAAVNMQGVLLKR